MIFFFICFYADVIFTLISNILYIDLMSALILNKFNVLTSAHFLYDVTFYNYFS